MYLNFLLMLLALALAGRWRARLERLKASSVVWPLLVMFAWVLMLVLAGPRFEDTPTRVFHIGRVALVVMMGLVLARDEAMLALKAFLAGSALAGLIVAAHHAWGLPDWAIWSSLLASRNNFSSANMICMACAAGLGLVAWLRAGPSWRQSGLALLFTLWMAATVGMHALSRNAQLLLPVLLLGAVVWRFRSLRATLAGMAVLMAMVAAVWHFSPTTQLRFVGLVNDYREHKAVADYTTSVGARLRMNQEAIDGMAAHPVTGTGVGSWLPNWRRVWPTLHQGRSPAEDQRNAEINNPHNEFLLAGMETGVPGLLILVWFFAAVLRRGWRDRSRAGGANWVLGIGLCVTAAMNAPLRDAAMGTTLLWLLGASMAAQQRIDPP